MKKEDWSFEEIKNCSPSRAKFLENCGEFDDLINQLVKELKSSIKDYEYQIAIDSIKNETNINRACLQFKVCPSTYDWFFNARTGYRAQYMGNPEQGIICNKRLVQALKAAAIEVIAQDSIKAKRISIIEKAHKIESEIEVSADFLKESFGSDDSKIWICECLYNSPVEELLLPLVRSSKNLQVKKWEGSDDGLRALYPEESNLSWLDLKGAFVCNGTTFQLKGQEKRARQIHETGWT
jgi:hypothetical protein